MSHSKGDPIIRVVMLREITYQGPKSWVDATIQRRILGAQVMGVRDGVPQIVAAEDKMVSRDLGPLVDLEMLARATTKLVYGEEVSRRSMERRVLEDRQRLEALKPMAPPKTKRRKKP